MAACFKDVRAGFAFLFLAAGVNAAEHVWTGGGADPLWSNFANWDTGVPGNGDTLVFAGSAKLNNTNDLPAETAFGGLTFAAGAGAFTLSGNAVRLDGDIRSQAATSTIGLPLVLSGDRLCLASNASVTLSGVISGPGGLRFEGQWGTTNAFALYGDNTFGGPVVVTNQCRLAIYSPTALGSAAAGTTVYGPNETRLEIYGGLTLDEPLTFLGTDGAPNYYPCLRSYSGTNVLNAPVYTSYRSARFRVYDNALILRGGVISPDTSGTLYLEASPGADLIVTNRPLFLGYSATLYAQYTGRVILAEPGNTYGYFGIIAGCTVRTDAPNALSPYGIIQYGTTWSTTTRNTLDLNGFCQTIGGLYASSAANVGYFTVTSAVPAVLTTQQRTATPFRGEIAGEVSLFKSGSLTLTLTNLVLSTASRPVTVYSGKLELGNTAGSPGGFSALQSVQILPSATLALNNGTGLPDTSEVSVQAGGTVDVRAGVTETVARLYLNGVQQADGTWGRTGSGADHIDDTVFTGGTGLLRVTDGPGATVYADAFWDAGGTDTLLTTAENWADDTLPTFAGGERAVFSAGTAAGVDTAASFCKLTFDRDANVSLTDSGGSLTLGRGGVEAGSPVTTRNHYIYSPVTLASDQYLYVTNAYLLFENVLSDGGNGFGLTLGCLGAARSLYLSADNTYSGKTVVKTNCYINVRHGNGLGSAAGDTFADNGGYIQLANSAGTSITVTEPLVLDGDKATSYGGTLRNLYATNVVSGPISGLANSARIGSRSTTAALEITGGISGDSPGSIILTTDGGGTITVREKPVFAHAFYANGKFYSGNGMIIMAVSGSVARSFYVNGKARLDVPNAFEYMGKLTLGNDGYVGYLDLNGFDLTTHELTYHANTTNGLIFSAAPATLTVDQSTATTVPYYFADAVSVVKLGAGNLSLTNGFTTTSGAFTVRDGTLTVGGTSGTLGPNSTNITVEGSGTLALAQANTSMLSDDATVRLPAAGVGTAKISLSNGVDETVCWLYCGDRLMPPGTYGATGSGAQYKDDLRFSGPGLLRVRRGTITGTLLRVY